MRHRGSRFLLLGLAAITTGGCAARCTLTPIDTVSSHVDARVLWDANGNPAYDIVTVIPWTEMRARARQAESRVSRIILSAEVVDACGREVAGHAWSRQVDLETAPEGEFFEQRVRLATVSGAQRLSLAVLLQGDAYGALWQRTYEVPDPIAAGLLLEPAEFLLADGDSAAGGELPARNVARYYDERTGAPRVRWKLLDFAPSPADSYRAQVQVFDANERVVFEDAHTVTGTGASTFIETRLPLGGLGRYEVELRVQEGTRIASNRERFEVGLVDLSAWGRVEEGRDLLLLLFGAAEVEALQSAAPDERTAAWDTLWKRHDPDPSTERNEFQEAILQRIQIASVRFSEGRSGWQSDRGRVFVAWGAPEEIEVFESPNALDRMERWTYDAGNTVFVFVDEHRTGEFVLRRTNATEFLERMQREH